MLRYTAVTVFVDHYSNLTYLHLMKRLISVETVEAKLAFEAYARNKGDNIQHYHRQNFIQSIEDNGRQFHSV